MVVAGNIIHVKYKCLKQKLILLLFVVWLRVTWDNFWTKLACA